MYVLGRCHCQPLPIPLIDNFDFINSQLMRIMEEGKEKYEETITITRKPKDEKEEEKKDSEDKDETDVDEQGSNA